MVGKTNAVGGAKPFGYIFVKYPAGSTVGIVNALDYPDATKSIIAETKTGYYVFPVPYAGDWIVACWTGNDPMNAPEWDNTVVTISAGSPYAIVELSYNLMLYDNGNQCTATTGGWKVQNGGNSNCAINANNIYIGYIADNSSGAGHSAHTINKVSFSGYKTLKATINVTVAQNDIAFGVVSTANRTGNTFVAKTSTKTTGQQTLSVDISSCNTGSYYVLFEGLYTRATITKVWCEK